MPNPVLTFAEFRTRIKAEAQLNDTATDSTILNLTNEILTEIICNTKDLRDFHLDEVFTISDSRYIDITGFYFVNIEQVYYQVADGANYSYRWDLTEQSGLVGPAPVIDKPAAYTIVNKQTLATTPTLRMTFYPNRSASVNDKIQVIATGLKFLNDDSNIMPYPSIYPMLIRSILQRLQMMLNKDSDSIKQWDGLIQRGATGASQGAVDKANTENAK